MDNKEKTESTINIKALLLERRLQRLEQMIAEDTEFVKESEKKKSLLERFKNSK